MNNFKKNIPNILTISRIIMSIVAPIIFLTSSTIAGIVIYAIGGLTDYFDGYFARKFYAFSSLGRKLDATSDKLYATSIAILGLIIGNYLIAIPLLLELIIGGINLNARRYKVSIVTERVGKIKTCFLFPTLVLGILSVLMPALSCVFVPLLVVNTKLQLSCITTYKNQFHMKLISHQSINESDIISSIKQDNDSYPEHNKKLNPSQKINCLTYEISNFYTQNNFNKSGKKKLKKR